MAVRHRTSISILPLVAFVFLATSPTFSQNTSSDASKQLPTIKVRTGLVLVPTIVTDRSGVHVPGLKQEDFTVLQNGKPQQISFFVHVKTQAEPMKRPAVPSGVTNTVEGTSQRLTIFMFDLMNSSITEQQTARDQFFKLLSKSLDVKEPMCLLALDNRGLQVIHDFTDDPQVLVEALKTITGLGSGKDLPQDNPVDSMFRAGSSYDPRNPTSARSVAVMINHLRYFQIAARQQQLNEGIRTRLTLDAIRQVGEAFAGIPGRKSLIWATGGFPFDMNDLEKFEIDDQSLSGQHAKYDYGGLERSLLPYYESAWRALNNANIAVYPLDLEDLGTATGVNPSVGRPLPDHTDVRFNVGNLENFADATGGKLCDRSMDARACFRMAVDDSTDYYLLGFYENTEHPKAGWRKLSVRVARPEIRVRARSGYYIARPAEEAGRKDREWETALVSPLDSTGVPLTVLWTATTSWTDVAERHIGFSFRISAEGAKVDEQDSNHISLQFAAVATNVTGVRAGVFSQTVDGKLNPDAAKAAKSEGLTYPGSITLLPGEYRVTFGVRDNLSGLIGTVSAPLVVH